MYGLYAREDIVHPDGATGVIYKAGDQVTTLATDEKGKASVENLYLGSYFIKEITPPVGYLADENEYDLVCGYEGDLTATVKRECVSLEQVKKQPFAIIKAADNGETDADLLAGAGFTAYLVSDLEVKEDGSYDLESAKPVVLGENGATEIFTDEKGYACSIALPYGTYLVRETTTPHNYKPVDDFIVRITEHDPNTPQVWRVLLDEEFEAKLKIIKQDDETKKAVFSKSMEFSDELNFHSIFVSNLFRILIDLFRKGLGETGGIIKNTDTVEFHIGSHCFRMAPVWDISLNDHAVMTGNDAMNFISVFISE